MTVPTIEARFAEFGCAQDRHDTQLDLAQALGQAVEGRRNERRHSTGLAGATERQ